jgi:PIN domain nuclease of toxin-antitoxin system
LRLLLDTHTLLWLFSGNPSLSRSAYDVVANSDNQVLVSAVSAWEIATKVRLGKLPSGVDLLQNFGDYLVRVGFEQVAISVDHGVRAGLFPEHHKDPFDRMLAAQCQAESIPIVSNDKIFDVYGVRRIW